MTNPRRYLALTAVLVTFLAGCSTTSEPSHQMTNVASAAPEKSAPATVPNVVGKPLDQARTTLEDAGFAVETHDAVKDRSILLEENWVVTTQKRDGDTVVLGARKSSDKTEAEQKAASKSASARAKAIESDLLLGFGVKHFSDLLAKDPSMWAGYIADVTVKDGNLYVTLQETDKELAQRAAKALSTLIPARQADGLEWVIVTGPDDVVEAQKQLSPIS